MWILVLQILAGLMAFTGLAALFLGAMAKSDGRRKMALRGLQFSFALAGAALSATPLFGADVTNIVFGMTLLIFATAVTGFGPQRPDRKPDA